MTNPARPPERLSDVNNPLTLNRRGRLVENDEYAAFARRVLRAYARRVADGDVEAFTLMLGLSAEIDTAISQDRKSTRLNSSHSLTSRMPSSA